MPETLSLLLKVYVATVVLNIFISFIQSRESNWNTLQKTTLLMWSGALIQFFLQGLFPQLGISTVLAFSTLILQNIAISKFGNLALGTPHNARLLFLVFIASWVLAIPLSQAGFSFTAYSFPVAAAMALPMLLIAFNGIKRSRKEHFSFVQKAYFFSTLFLGVHLLDYPFLRPDPNLALLGFSLMYAFIHILSIIIPMMVNENVFNSYSSRLESEVKAQTEELRNTEKKLYESSRMASLGRMAGGVAHEINSPLSIIKLTAERIIRESKSNQLSADSAIASSDTIIKTVDRISQITTALRKVSRDGELGNNTLVPIQQLLGEVSSLAADRVKLASVKLELPQLSSELNLDCNPVEIAQVLVNLINNSIDAVEDLPQKWIKIDVKTLGSVVEIRVTDSGQIDPSILSKIMDPFFTTKPVGKGTGLGLSVSKGIVEKHCGQFFVDEAARNTSFVIQLPLRQPQGVVRQ